MALRLGRRGMPGGSSLALLLAQERGVRNYWTRPALSVEQILTWADAHHERTGEWPRMETGGPVFEAPQETWLAIDQALKQGGRGLPGGNSLARLLAAERNVPNRHKLPRFHGKEILAWAVAHHERTGAWPNLNSGPIPETCGDDWAAVDCALAMAIAACEADPPWPSFSPSAARSGTRKIFRR